MLPTRDNMASYSVLKRPRDSADYRLISQAIDGGEKNEPNAVPGVKTNALARVVKRFCYSQNERVTFKFQTFFFSYRCCTANRDVHGGHSSAEATVHVTE